MAAAVQKDLENAMGTMRQSMETMAQREAQLGGLDEKSSHLRTSSLAFQNESRRLEALQRWNAYRMYVVIFVVAAELLALVAFPSNFLPFTALVTVFCVIFAVLYTKATAPTSAGVGVYYPGPPAQAGE